MYVLDRVFGVVRTQLLSELACQALSNVVVKRQITTAIKGDIWALEAKPKPTASGLLPCVLQHPFVFDQLSLFSLFSSYTCHA
jgi:hypothetical protein